MVFWVLKNIFSLQNEEVATDNKYALGGRWLRGFDSYGAGPRNSSTSYIGGNTMAVTNSGFHFPLVWNWENKNGNFLKMCSYSLFWDLKTGPPLIRSIFFSSLISMFLVSN